ncbi:MAG: tRNA lysidine(34) synthetase TilS [Puniceicoccales bacterium]|jgi:tRNA(Ile)-lysidine synthase|nr:tRNA lysidine(34) synthetase TilS [Puniceicoccales bacterium]
MEDCAAELDDGLFSFLKDTAPVKLCVACSGGSDSMALLSLLCEKKSLRHRLVVLHFNHGTRGDASDGDADFVQCFAADMRISFIVGCSDGTVTAHSGEELLRRYRFRFFHREMARLSSPYLLTAHNRDDVIETFLMRLARGSSVDGLVALRPVEHRLDGRVYIRPLLSCSKNSLRNYLLARHIPWREDESNASDLHLRNRVRHRLLPIWRTLEPQRALESCLLRTRALLVEDADALEELSQHCFLSAYLENCLRVEALHGQPAAILRRVLHLFFLKNGHVLGRALIECLLRMRPFDRPFKISITPELSCISDGRKIYLLQMHPRKSNSGRNFAERNFSNLHCKMSK